MLSDPIADMLTRLRNALAARHPKVDVPASKLKTEIARILKDRKSTRLNSSHSQISYAVFCLKKKKNTGLHQHDTTQEKTITNTTPPSTREMQNAQHLTP